MCSTQIDVWVTMFRDSVKKIFNHSKFDRKKRWVGKRHLFDIAAKLFII